MAEALLIAVSALIGLLGRRGAFLAQLVSPPPTLFESPDLGFPSPFYFANPNMACFGGRTPKNQEVVSARINGDGALCSLAGFVSAFSFEASI